MSEKETKQVLLGYDKEERWKSHARLWGRAASSALGVRFL